MCFRIYDPPFSLRLFARTFFLFPFVSREIIILVSRHSGPFLYLATKDVRVELNRAIGLNNSLFNEFETFDVGIPKYSSGKKEREERKVQYIDSNIAQIFFLIQDSLLYLLLLYLSATYMFMFDMPLRRLSGMSNIIRKTIKMRGQELLRVANKYVECKSRQ